MRFREFAFRMRSTFMSELIIRLFDFDVPRKLPNVKFPVYLQLSKNISELLNRGGGQEVAERALFRKISKLHEIMYFFDVGANIGQYSWEFLSIDNRNRAILFEPDPRNCSTIRKTIGKSELENCELLQILISDRLGSVNFNLDPITGKQGSILEDTYVSQTMARPSQSLDIASSTVDIIVEEYGPPSILKIDVEGAERLVLFGAGNTLAKHRPVIFIEVAERNFSYVENYLHEYGYELFDVVTLVTAQSKARNVICLHPEKHASIYGVVQFGE